MEQEFSLLRGLEYASLPVAVATQIIALPLDHPKMGTLWRIFTNMKPAAQQEVIGMMAFLTNKEAA